MQCSECFKEIYRPCDGVEIEYSPSGKKTYWHVLCSIKAQNMMLALKITFKAVMPNIKEPDKWGTIIISEEWKDEQRYWQDEIRNLNAHHERQLHSMHNAVLNAYSDMAHLTPPPPIVLNVENPDEFIKKWREVNEEITFFKRR